VGPAKPALKDVGVAIGFVVVVIAIATVRIEGDRPVPASLEPFLEPARALARDSLGVVGLPPARFVEARCTSDGLTAVLTFESLVGSVRSFATIRFPSPEERGYVGAAIGIVGSSILEVETNDAASCARAGPIGRVPEMNVLIVGQAGIVLRWRAATDRELAAIRWDADSQIGHAPLSDRELVLGWMATVCDQEAALTVAPGRLLLTRFRTSDCDGQATRRGLALTFPIGVGPADVDVRLMGPVVVTEPR
jgi:hypothetical protein